MLESLHVRKAAVLLWSKRGIKYSGQQQSVRATLHLLYRTAAVSKVVLHENCVKTVVRRATTTNAAADENLFPCTNGPKFFLITLCIHERRVDHYLLGRAGQRGSLCLIKDEAPTLLLILIFGERKLLRRLKNSLQ